jgi:hypothetical protein
MKWHWPKIESAIKELNMVVDISNPTTWEAETGGSWVWDWAGLFCETLSQNETKQNKKPTITTKRTSGSEEKILFVLRLANIGILKV